MSDRTYTNITQEEFEKALAETEHKFELVDYDWTKELIYESPSHNGEFIVRVYSSLNRSDGQARDKGSDAIRTVVIHQDTGRPVLSSKRTNRIQTWKKNLKQKINNISEQQSEVEMCAECSNPMVIRTNSDEEKFYGCSTWPECDNTKSYN